MTTVTQEQVDRVAAFVDACTEAKQEPFFGPDDEANFRGSSNGGRITFTFADRLHFRSALVPFRRLWSPADPAHWEATLAILKDSGLPQPLVVAARNCEAQARWEINRKEPPNQVSMGHPRVLELWLNVVVFADPLRASELRAEFDRACLTYSHAAMEHAFRTAVKWTGYHFLRLSDQAAEPALAAYRESGLAPSFAVGSTIRIRRRETLPSGTVVVRQGVSDFAPEETFEEKFRRLLEQHENRALQVVFKHIDATTTELVLAVVRSRSFVDLLTSIGGRIETCVFSPDGRGAPPRDDFRSSHHSQAGRFNSYANNFIVTDDHGVNALETNLKRFRAQLLS